MSQKSQLDLSSLRISYQDISPTKVGPRSVDGTTLIGHRPSQEDRMVIIPQFFDSHTLFCGVFDGTVGHHASEFISRNIVKHLVHSDEISDTSKGVMSFNEINSSNVQQYTNLIKNALRKTFLNADKELLHYCDTNKLHYASSTGVTAFIRLNILSVAHVGDSKACIARVVNGEVHPEWLTMDHKPNMPNELARIQQSGGSLTYLHGNKPFIRGGDFFRRQAAGEHPKQLNYSRAFGGKDLKMFGLSAEPDISHFELLPEDELILLASDGLWDVVNPKVACEIAFDAHARGLSASRALAEHSVANMPRVGYLDNVTVIAIFLRHL